MASVTMNPSFKQEMGLPQNSLGWQQTAATAGVAAIQQAAPGNGKLSHSIYSRVQFDGVTTHVLFLSPVSYASAQETGTGLYGPMKKYITPKRGRFLSWVGPGGQRVFAEEVAGVRPRLYFYRGMVKVFGPAQVRSYAASGGKKH